MWDNECRHNVTIATYHSKNHDVYRLFSFHQYEYESVLRLTPGWLTVVKGDLKAPFSITTTPKRWIGRHFFLWSTPFTLDPYLIMLKVKEGGIKYHSLSLWYDLNWTPVPRTMGKKHCEVFVLGFRCECHTIQYIITFLIFWRSELLHFHFIDSAQLFAAQ